MTALADFLEQHLFSCPTKALLGLDCPGCGMQRAFIALLRGDLKESLSLNASLVPFLMTIFYTIAHLLIGFDKGARWIVILFSATALIMLLSFAGKLAVSH